MKKSLALAFLFLGLILGTSEAEAAFGHDRCNPEPECPNCAVNKPETLVKLKPCTKRDKPYNMYTYEPVATKTVSSGRYDWSLEEEE